jgi:hypothetical protein
MTPIRIAAVGLVVALSAPGSGIRAGPSDPVRAAGPGVGWATTNGPGYGTYAWPVRGPVIRGFEPPPDPFGQGHRGIDIAVPFATDLVAAAGGVVAFAGWVAGSLFISIDHPDGVRTTYSWLSNVQVKEGDVVSKRQVIGQTGHGHPEVPTPHLHFGARIGSTYIDPMLLLERGSVVGLIHLAPVSGRGGPGGLPPSYNERPWPSPLGPGSVQRRSPPSSRRAWPVDSPQHAPPASRPPPGPRSRAVPAISGWPPRAPPSPA